MGELFKYLPTLVKYAKYLRYLVYLMPLIDFIKEAQRKYQGAGTGQKKLAWVRDQFSQLVTLLESSDIIPAKLATALRDGAESVISVIVQIIKAAGGFDEPGGGTGDAPPYMKPFPLPLPDDDALKAAPYGFAAGDNVFVGETSWAVGRKGQPTLGQPVHHPIK